MPQPNPQPGEQIQVCGPVWLLAGSNQGRFPFSHGVLIKDRQTCLIDTGCGKKVIEDLASTGGVDFIINTHTHPDHTSGNHLLPGVPVWSPEMSRDTAGRRQLMKKRFMGGEEARAVWLEFVRREMNFYDRVPDHWYGDGHEFRVGGTLLRVVHTPGHTADHCCLHLPDLGLLISADIDLTPFGPWYGNAESSLQETRESLEKVGRLAPNTLVSAHRPPLTQDIWQAMEQYLAAIDRNEGKITGLLKSPMTLDQLVDAAPIYGHHPYYPPLLRYWEGGMIKEHLKELLQQGRVRQVEEGYLAC